jgi:flavorubredoxin
MDAYRDWISDKPKNQVVVPYISMHGSTRLLVERLVASLTAKGITVCQFDCAASDLGKLAISLVDAATVVFGTPTVHVGPHPAVLYAALLANALRPKTMFASVVGSYGWAGKAADQLVSAIPNLKAEILPPVVCKGMPRAADFDAIERLSSSIVEKHSALGLLG